MSDYSESALVKVKSRPILFSGPMVRAILEGKKTTTRRVTKLPLPWDSDSPMTWAWSDRKRLFEPVGKVWHMKTALKWGVKCPYGVVGDRLWVRETFQSLAKMNHAHPSEDQYVYRATDPDWETTEGWKWKPSIFMPRDACRIHLRIESIRVERLQSITDAEIVDEGFRDVGHGVGEIDNKFSTLRGLFSGLWNEINGKGSWEANPFVWVVGFSRLEGTGDE
jgi:hypothetical protein